MLASDLDSVIDIETRKWKEREADLCPDSSSVVVGFLRTELEQLDGSGFAAVVFACLFTKILSERQMASPASSARTSWLGSDHADMLALASHHTTDDARTSFQSSCRK